MTGLAGTLWLPCGQRPPRGAERGTSFSRARLRGTCGRHRPAAATPAVSSFLLLVPSLLAEFGLLWVFRFLVSFLLARRSVFPPPCS